MRKFRIHIKYINGMTVSKLSDSVNILDEAFSTFSEENRISLSESD